MAPRKSSNRKPAPRRRKPTARSGTSAARLGWIAAAVMAVGWTVSDGRVITFVQNTTESAQSRVATLFEEPAQPDRQQERQRPRDGAPAPRHSPAQPTRAMQPHAGRAPSAEAGTAIPRQDVERDTPAPQLTAVTPSPAPRLAPMRAPSTPVSAPGGSGATADRGAIRPLPEAPVSPPSQARTPRNDQVAVATGLEERHATRRLDMRSMPGDRAPVLAAIETGTLVHVIKADGAWRYVKSPAFRAEGWVDGTYLAGESAPLRLPSARGLETRASDHATAAGAPGASRPVPPAAIAGR